MAEFPRYVPPGTVMVLNTSGTFQARTDIQLPRGGRDTVYFSQMTDDATGYNWVVTAPPGCRQGDVLQLAGGARLQLSQPHLLPSGEQATLRWTHQGSVWYSGEFWQAVFSWDGGRFAQWHQTHAGPVVHVADPTRFGLRDLQNGFATRMTSSRMNNGGRNLTTGILRELVRRGVHLANVEVRTSIGADQHGNPFNESVRLAPDSAALINRALRQGNLVLPVGTGVIRALDWFYSRSSGTVSPGAEWCRNIITPETGTWLNSWVSGMHEPRSSHLAMGAAVMGENVIRCAMLDALREGLWFHENGDTHLHLPV
jgi:S-adenosylmethionine:tRNA ribosyltransferase-isomerase